MEEPVPPTSGGTWSGGHEVRAGRRQDAGDHGPSRHSFPRRGGVHAHSVKRAFDEMQRWKAPHRRVQPQHPPRHVAEIVDDYELSDQLPAPDGLVLGKMRGMHIPSTRFWDEIGFGYKKLGSGEGHW